MTDPVWRWRALAADGKVLRGTDQAGSREAALKLLTQRGLSPLSCRRSWRRRRLRLSSTERIDFTRRLAIVVGAGFPVQEALKVLSMREGEGGVDALARQLLARIGTGQTFSAALAASGAFDRIYVTLAVVGERSSRFALILEQLASHLEWRQNFSARISRATLYPLAAALATAALFVFMLVFLVPRFSDFLSALDSEPGFSTRLAMRMSAGLSDPPAILIPLVLAPVLLFVGARLHPGASRALDRLLLHLPFWGALVLEISLTRVTSTLVLLHSAKVDMIESLSLVQALAGNRAFEHEIEGICRQIQGGRSLAEGFSSSRLFPPLFSRSAALAERSGTFDSAFSMLADYYRLASSSRLDKLERLLPSLILLLAGGSMLWLILAIFAPLYEVALGLGAG